ncbi:MAG TPA: hypothetical protein VNY07_06405 [Chthoniobacterales bacterium]|jgi:hypothetical protein|nr:hypothetical protein [Chthoniobacterales bacterium]
MKIGISGHQNLGPVNVVEWVRAQIRDELIRRDFSSGVSSLAEGADQLFAELVVTLGKLLEVVIPCRNYESAFKNPIAAQQFRSLKDKAVRSYILNFDGPSEEAFFQAGRSIVDASDLMVFVWNGKPAKGHGGTADIVDYAKQVDREFIWINPARAEASAKQHM